MSVNHLKTFTPAELEATRMRSGRWVVRPRNAVGTYGLHPRPWVAISVSAKSEAAAIRRAIA